MGPLPDGEGSLPYLPRPGYGHQCKVSGQEMGGGGDGRREEKWEEGRPSVCIQFLHVSFTLPT